MAAILDFDEARLVNALERLPKELRVVFAAACAERLLPAHDAFAVNTGRGQPATLRNILTRLWDDLSGNRLTDGEVQANIDACMQLIPREEEGQWVAEQDLGEDAAAATAYAFRCRKSGNSHEAAWSARRAFEALDRHVSEIDNIDWSVPDPKLRELTLTRILSHPLVQAELARQRRDLEELADSHAEALHRLIVRLRDRAKADGPIFFGSARRD